MVAGARYITVCDAEHVYHQTPVADSEQYDTLLCRAEREMGV